MTPAGRWLSGADALASPPHTAGTDGRGAHFGRGHRPLRAVARNPLNKDEGWTEFTLNCDARGTRLFVEISDGRVQGDWAEVVFANGVARVVDFREKTHKPGLYQLLDFKDGGKIDHVRLVARAKSKQARVALLLQK